MARRLRVGLIGLGMAVAPHAKSLADLKARVDVVGAFSPSAVRRQAFADGFKLPVVDTLGSILRDQTVDAVAILTPPGTHLDLVEQAARAGKHILLEKPLEISTTRAERLIAEAERAGVVLGVTLQHRFRPAAERLADLLRDGQLGSIVSCSTTIRLWRPQSYYDQPGRGTLARDGGGVLITQGIHTLDLLGALMGRVAEAKSFVRSSAVHRMETEDLVAAAVRFENGAIGVVEATTAAYPGSAERIAIIGTTGTAVLEGNALTVQWQDGRREALAAELGGGGTGANPMDFPHDWHRGVWTDFLDAIATGGKPRISGRDALDVHRLIDALLAGDRDATKGSNRA